MSRRDKKITIAVLLLVIVSIYFDQVTYALYLVGIYPVKAQVKDVSVEFYGAWLPSPSSEFIAQFSKLPKKTLPSRVFFKVEGSKPLNNGTIVISWVGDNFEGVSPANNIYRGTLHFDWGAANILKKELTNDPTRVFAVVPEFKILIRVDNLDQLKEVKKLTKIIGAGS